MNRFRLLREWKHDPAQTKTSHRSRRGPKGSREKREREEEQATWTKMGGSSPGTADYAARRQLIADWKRGLSHGAVASCSKGNCQAVRAEKALGVGVAHRALLTSIVAQQIEPRYRTTTVQHHRLPILNYFRYSRLLISSVLQNPLHITFTQPHLRLQDGMLFIPVTRMRLLTYS